MGEFMGFGLGALPFWGRSRTRSISAENPTGGKGMGGMAIPNPSDPTFDIASVAYWYQDEPHVEFPPFPALDKRWPR